MSEARAALRARLGAGARWDDDAAPRDALLLARRGRAAMARRLALTPDAALVGDARRVVAGAALDARDLAHAAEAARLGRPFTAEARAPRLARALSLPDRALRSLFAHAEAHLDVEWRDLPAAGWDARWDGATMRDAPAAHAATLWAGAVALGLPRRQLPPDLAAT